MTFYLLPAGPYEVRQVCKHMRQSDRYETQKNALATGRWTPDWDPANDMLAAGQLWAITTAKGKVVAVGGVAEMPQFPGVGAIWLIGSDLADRYWRAMTILAGRFVQLQRKNWKTLANIVPAEMPRRVAWMQHLGFDRLENEVQLSGNRYVAFSLQSDPGPEA